VEQGAWDANGSPGRSSGTARGDERAAARRGPRGAGRTGRALRRARRAAGGRPFGRARGQAAALYAAGLKDPDVAADCLISLAGADHDDPESRAARYVGYAENAAESAERTAEYLETRANTERRHRLSSGKLENEVEKAEYWRQRAQGSLAWAEYRQTAPVIKRRIEGLEKDERKHQKEIKDAFVNQCHRLGQILRKPDGKLGLFIKPEKREEAEREAASVRA
jgi:hypothetical protein